MKGNRVVPLLIAAALLATSTALPQSHVASTVHNLSVTGPGEVRSASETEVCRFCHIPHSAVVRQPLWGHALSRAGYQVPKLRRGPATQPAPQPDGSSRLCLSCHDGTVALGRIGPSQEVVPMSGAQRLGSERRGFIGTDLSGSHPISIPVPDQVDASPEADMVIRPRSVIESDPHVKLDAAGKIQCTTCHDPHSDRFFREGELPHFWVGPSVDEVCLACHELR